ncbi:MAG: ribonuclease III [Gemmatimonadetes bacterium]|nr:ribonuclease III [Gemmatimonadota bacterium]
MKDNQTNAIQGAVSVLEKLFFGTRKGPSGERSRLLRKLQKRIGVRFTDISLLEQALTHRSYSHVTAQTRNDSNERMEFLGDSVLGLSVSQFLYLQFPERSEGALSKMKSLLVSRKVLSTIAKEVGLGEFVLLSGEESEMGGRDRTSILADSFEGVIGAIYLDQGYRTANRFIQKFLLANIHEILKDDDHTNFKSLLQEYVQSKRLSHPVYRVRKEEGPEHEKEFAIDVVVKGEVWGTGRGKSKKDAEQNAARAALEKRQGKVAGRRGGNGGSSSPENGDAGESAPTRGRGRRRGRGEATEVQAEARQRGDHGIVASREKLREARQAEEDSRRRGRDRRPSRRGRAESEVADSEAPAEAMENGGRGRRTEGETDSRPRSERRRRRRRRGGGGGADDAPMNETTNETTTAGAEAAASVVAASHVDPGTDREMSSRDESESRAERESRAEAREPERVEAPSRPAPERERSEPEASTEREAPPRAEPVRAESVEVEPEPAEESSEPEGFVRRRRTRRESRPTPSGGAGGERPPVSTAVERLDPPSPSSEIEEEDEGEVGSTASVEGGSGDGSAGFTRRKRRQVRGLRRR